MFGMNKLDILSSENACKFASVFAYVSGNAGLIENVLRANLTHYNFDNRYLLNRYVRLHKKKAISYSAVCLVIDSVLRLYCHNEKMSYLHKLLKIPGIPQDLPLGYGISKKETFLPEINARIDALAHSHECALFHPSNNYAERKINDITVEINFSDQLIAKNNKYDTNTKIFASNVYKAILEACYELGYKIVPVFSHRWSCNKDTKTDHNLFIGYHYRTDQDKHLMFKASYLPDYTYFDKKGFSGWSSATEIGDNDLNDLDKNKVEVFYNNLYKYNIKSFAK